MHHRPFRDTSRILDVLTREHGRISVIARGARSAKSRLRGILRPFMPLSLSWFMRSELGTLTGADMDGKAVQLTGDALMSGYYINELLLKLLHRHDPQPEIFDAYAATVKHLSADSDVAPLLRQFEMELLRLLGYALSLDHDSQSHQPLQAEQHYEYRADQGPVAAADRTGTMVFSGRQLGAIRRQEFSNADTLSCASRLLRNVIAHRLDGKELNSRKVLRDLKKTRGPDRGTLASRRSIS
ncbi:MAG: DNA repair protein RecO [Gammaproteobacteria bacterium]|nr:DNA repair protein RecO [Gammaproteobacteria bacterium]